MRTVIYARFSSALQNSRSIEDQVNLCRKRCEGEGWEVVDVFTDFAISGAAGIDEAARPGLNAMLARVEEANHPDGRVDQVLAEATDRIARHQGDAFTIRERINFAGARLFTLSDGEVNDLTGMIRGWSDAQFRKDLGAKVKRGQRGTLAQGRSPGGKAYGYRLANRITPEGKIIRGLREIDDEQAEVVRRIFREYAAGRSPRAIANGLNADGIPGPRGGEWNASTINGDRKRKNGILQNQLYIGRIVHERTSKITDPKTRKTLIRPNSASDWQEGEAPHLQIIDAETWEKVQIARNRHSQHRPERARRPKHVLSGLAYCGTCGSGWTIRGGEYWSCSRHRESGPAACSNNRTIRTDTLEARVFAGLTDQLLDPAVVDLYVREYHLEHARRAGEIARERDRLTSRHARAVAKVNRLVEAVALGADEFAEIRAVLQRARDERDGLAAALADLETLPVIALHPTVAADYRREVTNLHKALAANPESQLEAIPKLRSLIDRIDIFPATEGRGTRIEVSGRLHSMAALATGNPLPDEIAITVERVKGIRRYRNLTKVAV